MEEENIIKKSSAWGISSLVTSIISVPFMFLSIIGLPLAIYAIVAHNKQKAIMPTGISMGGYVIGIISTVLNSIMLLLLLFGLLIMGGAGVL